MKRTLFQRPIVNRLYYIQSLVLMRNYHQINILLLFILTISHVLGAQVCSATTNYGNSIDLCKCSPSASIIDGSCKICQVANCILCSLYNEKECDVCKTGYVLDSLTKSQCVPAVNQTLQCTSATCQCSVYEVYKDGYCVSCLVKNCLLCSINEPTQCDVCQSGYVLDKLTLNSCVPKTNLTISCSSSTASCACSPYQVSVNGVCTDCAVSNCRLCSPLSAKQCDICKSGFVLDNLTQTTCVPKSNSTSSCSSSSTYCGCALYQVNVNGLCTACQVSNCKLCAIANPYECDVCNSGYVLDGLTKLQCVLKSNATLSCNSNSNTCLCSPYSAKSSDGTCLTCQVSNCILCSWNNSKQCDICKTGYILDKLSQSVCVLPQKSTISCTPNSLFCKCSVYQVNLNGVCEDCKSKNCRLCSATDPNDCDVCLQNYIYNSSTKSCDAPICALENQIWGNDQCECNPRVSFKNDKGECELHDKVILGLAIGIPITLSIIGVAIATLFFSNRNPLAPAPQQAQVVVDSSNQIVNVRQEL